jgi:creatinine amidohydrolase
VRWTSNILLALFAGVLVIFGYNHYLIADALRPPKPDTVWLQDMTWPEVRQALNDGYDTVIVPFGGTEQGGLHLILGKHNHIIAATAEQAARQVGKVLITPVMPFAPEGGFDPPTGNMPWIGTLGLRPATFAAVAEDLANSLKSHGFKLILFVADHGLSGAPLAKLAKRLDEAWHRRGIRVRHLAAYYDNNGQQAWLRRQEFKHRQIGNHAGIRDTAELMQVHPKGVRLDRRHGPSFRLGEDIGTNGDPSLATVKIGKMMLDLKIKTLVTAIRELRK